MAVGALALLLALGVTVLSLAQTRMPELPFGYRLRALFWGPGHLLQFLHVAGTIAVWLVAAGGGGGGRAPAPPRRARLRAGGSMPFLIVNGGAVSRVRARGAPRRTTWSRSGPSGGWAPAPCRSGSCWWRSGAAARSPGRLPWGSPVFSGTALSLALFAAGGILGVVGFNQDTRVPAHYHGMVGAVTLAYMGLAPLLLEISGRRLWSARVARWQPYLYGLGLLGIMAGMHWAGGHGAPRKTFGFTWANAQALVAMNLMGLGSLLAILGGLAFVLNVGIPLARRGR